MSAADGFDAPALARRDPPLRWLLLHGDDDGLVRARALAIAEAVTGGDGRDPFRVGMLQARQLSDDPRRLLDELAAQALTGGRRVVRLRDGTDRQIDKIVATLAKAGMPPGDSLLVIESGSLPSGGGFASQLAALGPGVAIACQPPTGDALRRLISERFRAANQPIERDAVEWLTRHLAQNHGVIDSEIEKLLLWARPGETLSADDVAEVANAGAEVALRATVRTALDGDAAATGRAVELALLEGGSPVALVRAMLDELDRIAILRRTLDARQSTQPVLRAFRPPIRDRDADRLVDLARRWPPAVASRLARALLDAEANCKTTALPDRVIAAQAYLEVALISRGVSRET